METRTTAVREDRGKMDFLFSRSPVSRSEYKTAGGQGGRGWGGTAAAPAAREGGLGNLKRGSDSGTAR